MTTITNDSAACRFIVELIYERTRIKLHDGKEALIKARLGKRMRHHRLDSLAEYVEFLRTSADEDEFTRVVDALTTNFTNFLRESDHFDYLVGHALGALLPAGRKKFRIWSAASSSGEEPYTLAMYLAEHFPVGQGWDWRITASDISTKVLALARRAVYPDDRVQTVPRDWLRRYFQQGTGPWAGQVRVRTELTQRVSFQQINLIGAYEHAEPYEVIFCRNVMIYFDRPTQEQLVNRLCRFLVPGGYLFIGHAESLNGQNVPLRCLKPSVYQHA
jgi:chemotaxis protein methyltransferase CheR